MTFDALARREEAMRIGRVALGFERADWRRKARLPARVRRAARREPVENIAKVNRGA